MVFGKAAYGQSSVGGKRVLDIIFYDLFNTLGQTTLDRRMATSNCRMQKSCSAMNCVFKQTDRRTRRSRPYMAERFVDGYVWQNWSGACLYHTQYVCICYRVR